MATMKKAAVVLDDYKLPVFERILKEEGYEYTNVGKWPKGCITLKVLTRTVAELVPIIKRCNEEGRKLKP